MERQQAIEYRQALADILKEEPHGAKRWEFLANERKTGEYQLAREVVISSRATTHLDNPLSNLVTSDKELTPNEQTIIWANQILDEYHNLPKQTGSERTRAKNLISEAGRRLLQNPVELDIAGSIWRSRSTPARGTEPNESFYALVKERSAKEVRDDWEKISPEQLAEWVRIFAHNQIVTDLTGNLLSAYFRGPQNRRQRVDALYKFTYGSLVLVDDPIALEEAVKIGQFQTEILPLGSDFHMDFFLAVNTTVDDDALLQKALNVDEIMFNLYRLTTLNGDEIKESIKRAYTDRFEDRSIHELDRMRKRLGEDEAIRRMHALAVLNNTPYIVPLSSARLKPPWPYYLKTDIEEPLRKKYAKVAQAYIDACTAREQIESGIARGKIIKDPVFLSIPTPNGYVLDVTIPASLIEKRHAILESALRDGALQQALENQPENQFGTAIATSYFRFEGSPVIFFLRAASGFEQNRHPLQALETIGYPSPPADSLPELIRINRDLMSAIQRQQIRFINRRGIRVILEPKELKELGYTQIDFRKDPEDAEKIQAHIFAGTVPYSIRLDRYFNFDFEGKRFDALMLREALHYTLLSLLAPILCEERLKAQGRDSIDIGEEVVSRMGHLRLLPEGQHYTGTAIKNCFSYEGRDLAVVDVQRQQDLKTSHHTTYVKPVIEKVEDLPPIVMRLHGALTF